MPSRLMILTPALGGAAGSTLSRQIAITPAGDAIVYGGLSNSGVSLFLRRLDSEQPTEIAGTQGIAEVAVSSDGKTLFGRSLAGAFRLPLAGGTPRAMPVPVSTAFTGVWAPDGSFWYSDYSLNTLVRVAPSDSSLALPRGKGLGLRVQQILSDGRSALVVRAPPGTASGPAMLFDLRNASLTPLLDGPVTEARYAAGELFAVLPDGSITATPFDIRRRRVAGSATVLATGVMTSGTGIAQFAVAANGTIAYIPETPRSLVLVRRSGQSEALIPERLNVHAPRFSPDGQRLSVDISSPDGRDVWTLALDRRSLTRATFDRDGHDAVWSPDGRSITYISLKGGTVTFYRTRPGSTEPPESLLASPHLMFPGTWLKDGSALIGDGQNTRGRSNEDIVRVSGNGRGPVEPLVASPYEESYGAPSPDGRWLAFVSNQSGTQEVFVRPLQGEGEQVQISQGGATEPVWSPNGRELFYRSVKGGKSELTAATLRVAPTLGVVSQRVLFGVDEMVEGLPHANYDVSPDGQTFAMVRRSPGSHIVVIQNVAALLRRLRSAPRATP